MKTIALSLCLVSVFTASSASANWPAWRGPLANGTAPDADPPIEWSDTKNVKWKVKIPGSGSASPVVWGNRVFLLTAVPAEKSETESPATPPPAAAATEADPGPGGPGGERRRGGGGGRGQRPMENIQFTVMCLDRATGKTLWQKVAREAVPHEGHHQDHGFASPSPVTDGQVVLAYFGSRGLHCYDLDGNLKWSKDFGQMRTRNSFGEGASPALHGDYVIINWDHEGDDFITALDRLTGKEIWRTPRQEETSWGTPLVVEYKGQKQIIVNATTKVRSYDLATGKELWVCGGQTGNAIPSAVADADTVYAMSGFRTAALQAISLGRTGDLTGTDAVRWSYDKNTPYVPSPLLVGHRLYFISQRGAMLTCFNTKTGQPIFEAERIPGFLNAYASPVAAQGRMYMLNREGKCAVIKIGDTPEVLAINSIPEGTDSTIALVGKELFLRGKEHLYCIAEN